MPPNIDMNGSVSQMPASTDYGKWQGAHWRRFCRGLIGFILLLAIGLSWLRASPSAAQVGGGLAFAAIVFALSDWMFARRMGFELRAQDLTLQGPLREIRIPWSDLQGLHWTEARRGLSRTKFLYVETTQRSPKRIPSDSPIRIPTVSFADSNLPNDRFLGPILTSRNVRAPDGREVDVFDLFERVRSNWALAASGSDT